MWPMHSPVACNLHNELNTVNFIGFAYDLNSESTVLTKKPIKNIIMYEYTQLKKSLNQYGFKG